ncbi:MAG: hypothetical protein HRF49_07595 [bacterium]|jgi:hypothetical protein
MPDLRVSVIIELDGKRFEGEDKTEINAGRIRIIAEAQTMASNLVTGLLAALPEDPVATVKVTKKGGKESGS